jgi:hypothetical protein
MEDFGYEYDSYGDQDEIDCANGDYNVFEERQLDNDRAAGEFDDLDEAQRIWDDAAFEDRERIREELRNAEERSLDARLYPEDWDSDLYSR